MSVNIELNRIMTIGNDRSYFRNLDEVFDSLITQNIIDFSTAKTILDKIGGYTTDKADRLEEENEELAEELDNLEDENLELRIRIDKLEKDNSRLFKNYMANLPA